MQLLGDAADNPDQRISEDIAQFIALTLGIGLQLLNAVVTHRSRSWSSCGRLSAAAPLHLFGMSFSIPGYLLWAALIYACIGTALTHLIGRPLIALNFQQQRYEADFRFNLVRVRENSEQIALLDGERAERDRLLMRFGNVVANWMAIMTRQKKLTFFTASYAQAAVVFPFIMVSPAYFANVIQLGGLMQTANAFGRVQDALSVFVDIYRNLAEWRAVIERLDGFDQSVASARAVAVTPPVIEVAAGETARRLSFKDLAVRLPNGVPLVNASDISIGPGERVLVSGPSGAGKSTLFRALAGIWPFGAGTITVPKDARLMMLPQRPYFPIAPLGRRGRLSGRAGHFRCRQRRRAGRRGRLAGAWPNASRRRRIGTACCRSASSSGSGIARALLHAPDYLFLDEATASLDEPSEAALYHLLQQRLAAATIVSIGHRSTLAAFHRRRLAFTREGDRYWVREGSLAPAA